MPPLHPRRCSSLSPRPPLLDQALWPEVKGDASSERDLQRARRGATPEARFLSLADVPPTPHEPPEHEQISKRDDRLTPQVSLEAVVAPPEPVPQQENLQQQANVAPPQQPQLSPGMGMGMQGGGMGMGQAGMGMGMQQQQQQMGQAGMGMGMPQQTGMGMGMGNGMPMNGGMGMGGGEQQGSNLSGLQAKLALQMMMGRSSQMGVRRAPRNAARRMPSCHAPALRFALRSL